jgi:hypothetical protein
MRKLALALTTLAFVLPAALSAEAGAAPTAAQDLCWRPVPDRPEWCPGPPPPPEPDCPLDPPPGLICREGPKELFEFVGADAAGHVTNCSVWLYGATPPDQNGGEMIQFRTTAVCDAGMRNITVNTRLLNTLQAPIASGPQGYCHEFATGASCGTFVVGSTGGIAGQAAGDYTLVATVRLALREGTGDPWVVVAGTTPSGSSELCAPGGYVTRCDLLLPIPADGI